MAIGFNFLSKTKMGALQNAGAVNTNNAQQTNNNNNIGEALANNGAKKQDNADMANMSTSDLIKYVYQNNGSQPNIKNKKSEDGENKLPVNVEYNNQKFSTQGKGLKEVAKDIALKTGDSSLKIESELKKKYLTSTKGAAKGFSLNLQA